MHHHRLRGGILGASVLLLSFLAGAGPVRADSVVYLKDGHVWIANADGSGARQFTQYAYGWSSPSEDDSGNIVAAGGQARVNPDGSDADAGSEIYRFQGDGNQIGSATPTYGSYSTPACPAYPPSSVRVSPDGTKIAYGIYGCGAGGYETALWTPTGSTTLNFPNQTVGQQDFWNPSWINNSRFTISHAGPPVFGAHWGEHLVTDADNAGQGWSESDMTDDAAEAVISRDGTVAAVFYNDAASYTDGMPRSVALWVYYAPSMPSDFSGSWPQPAQCTFTLDATRFSDINNLSPSLSPDGTKVMFGDDDGVELKSLGDVSSHCDGASSIITLLPGGSQPFYAKGNLQPADPNAVQPGKPDDTPAPQPAPQPGPQPGPQITLKPLAKFSIKTKKPRRGHRITFDASKSLETGGAIKSYVWSFGDGKRGKGRRATHTYRKAKTYKVTLTVHDASGKTAKVMHKLKVRR